MGGLNAGAEPLAAADGLAGGELGDGPGDGTSSSNSWMWPHFWQTPRSFRQYLSCSVGAGADVARTSSTCATKPAAKDNVRSTLGHQAFCCFNSLGEDHVH